MGKGINIEQELYKHFGRVKDFTLSVAIAKRFYDMGKNSQEPVSEELEKELSAYVNSKEYTNSIGTSGLLLIARHFADWQKQQMMKTAVDGKIYETQARSKLKAATIGKISSLKYSVGDKVKLIILKED